LRRVVPGLLFFPVIYRESASPYVLCPGLIFLTARSCQSEFGGAADEKLFTVAAAFNRPRDPCDPFLLCASNPLGGCALWVAGNGIRSCADGAARPPRQSDFRGRPQARSAARWASSS